jgi:hypothetical protein
MKLNRARRAAAALCVLALAMSAFADDSTDQLEIYGAPAPLIYAGSTYLFQPQSLAVGPLPVHFEIANAPSWATFQGFDGSLRGQPSAADSGVYPNISIAISDGFSRVTLPPFSIVVRDPNIPEILVLTWQAPTENVDGSPLTDLLGYYVYAGSSPNNLQQIAYVDSSTPTYALSSFWGLDYFAIVAVSSSGELSQTSSVLVY